MFTEFSYGDKIYIILEHIWQEIKQPQQVQVKNLLLKKDKVELEGVIKELDNTKKEEKFMDLNLEWWDTQLIKNLDYKVY